MKTALRTKKLMPKIDSIIEIKCGGNFFRWWMEVLKPLHGLTDRETDIAAAIIEQRWLLSKSITDPKMLDKVLFSTESAKEVRKLTGASYAYYHGVLAKMRKCGLLSGGKINLKCVPDLKDDSQTYKLMFLFNFGKEASKRYKESIRET